MIHCRDSRFCFLSQNSADSCSGKHLTWLDLEPILLLFGSGQHLKSWFHYFFYLVSAFLWRFPSAHIVHESAKNLSGVLTLILVFPSYVVLSYLKIPPLPYRYSGKFELCVPFEANKTVAFCVSSRHPTPSVLGSTSRWLAI